MKIKNLFYSSALAVLALVGCEKPVDLGPEKVELQSESVIELAATADETTVSFVATVDWKIRGYDEVSSWLTIEPEAGKASADVQTITIKALANEGGDRTASLEIYGNLVAKAALTINQKGSRIENGTKDHPYAASTALQMILDGRHDENAEVYISGIISEKGTIDTGSYGNAVYAISDDGSTTNQLDVYRGYYLNGAKFTSEDQINIGDEVIIVGKLVNYKGNTPQVTQGSRIYSLNGQIADDGTEIVGTPSGDGSEANPYNPAGFLKKYNESGTSSDEIYVKGIVSEIKTLPEPKYQSGDFYISSDGKTAGQLYVFHCKNLNGGTFASADDLKIGDEVVIKGKISAYNGSPQVGNGTLQSINGSTEGGNSGGGNGGGEGSEDYANAPAKTVKEFIDAADTQNFYKLSGSISNVVAASGNFDLTDDSGKIFVYKASNAADFASRLSEGDEIVLAGRYEYYEAGSKHEVMDAVILSLVVDKEAPEMTLTHPLTSNVTWTVVENDKSDKSYTQSVEVEGKEYDAIKLGTSSLIGVATLTIPNTAKTLSFYAIGWSSRDGVVEIYSGDTLLDTVNPVANAGANGTKIPYIITTLSDERDYYTIDLSSVVGATEIVLKSTSAGYRAILFGINAE